MFKSVADVEPRVENPETFRLLNVEVPDVLMPAIPVVLDAVTVTIPAKIADTVRLSPKFIVPAVPTSVPSSLIITPEPEPTTPESPEPSPIKEVAVTTPVTFTPPDVTDVPPENVEKPETLNVDAVALPNVDIPALERPVILV